MYKGKFMLPILTVVFSLIMSTTVLAAVSGTIEGVVKDADTGDPLIGANVFIVGTSLGSVQRISANNGEQRHD